MSDIPRDTPACAPYDPTVDPGSYGYRPSLAWGLVFTILFVAITLGQTYHMARTRAFWTFFFILGALFEVVGWIGRLVGYWCPYSRDCFIMQTASLITGENCVPPRRSVANFLSLSLSLSLRP